jgi:hypothetical protein
MPRPGWHVDAQWVTCLMVLAVLGHLATRPEGSAGCGVEE